MAEMQTEGGVAVIEAAYHIQDENPVSDVFAQVPQLGHHLLERPAVIDDGEVTLHELPELGVEVQDPCLPVAEKLGLEGKPGSTGSGVALHGGVGKVVGDGAVDPRLDYAIHACPVRENARRRVTEDVILQGELAGGEEELIAPPRVVPGVEVEEDGDEAADVLDGHRLSMEIQDGGGLVHQHGLVEIGAVDDLGVRVVLGFIIGGGGVGDGARVGRALEGVAGTGGSGVAFLGGGGGFELSGLGEFQGGGACGCAFHGAISASLFLSSEVIGVGGAIDGVLGWGGSGHLGGRNNGGRPVRSAAKGRRARAAERESG